MARHSKEESIYTISIHNNGGYRYASTHPYTMTEDGKRRYRIVHWGTVTGDLKFIPGKNYRQASEEERKRLIFPEGWDLSEIAPMEDDGQDHLYGDIWMLEQVIKHLDLYKIIEECFGFDHELIKDLLTLAIYPCLSDRGYSMISSWQRIVKAPARRLLEEDRIRDILRRVTPEGVGLLMHKMLDIFKNDRLCVVDSISKSAYGESLADLRWGRKKERIHLRMTVNAVIYSIESGLPLFYLPIDRTTSDSRGITDILDAVSKEGLDDVIVVTDRAYDAIQNLRQYIVEERKMVMCANVRQKFILDHIPAAEDDGGRPDGMVYNKSIRRFVRQYVLQKNDLKLNLFYNPTRRLDEVAGLEREIASQRKVLETMMLTRERMDDDRTLKQSYWWFNIECDENSRCILSYSPNEKRIDAARRTSGFYANVTSGLDMSATEAMYVYGFKYEQERIYDKILGQMDLRSATNDDCREGWRLILFLALQFSACIIQIWKRSDVLQEVFGTPASILAEMRALRWTDAESGDGQRSYDDVWKKLSTKQKHIVDAMTAMQNQVKRQGTQR